MANTNPATAAGRPAGSGSTVARRTSIARRRLLLVVVFLLIVLGVATAANYGPLRAYYDARARVEQATAAVAGLEEQRARLQSQLGRLTEADCLETLARQELTYARPGEEVYIVTGAGALESAPEVATPETVDRRGPLERFLSALGNLF